MEYKHFDMKPMIYQASRLNPPEVLCQGTVDGYNFYWYDEDKVTHWLPVLDVPFEEGIS